MPRIIHGFYDASNDERLAIAATRSKQNVEVVLAILALLKLEEYPIFKRLNTRKFRKYRIAVFHSLDDWSF